MNDKVCRVDATDSSGAVRQVAVIARSRNEAAARAIEELTQKKEWALGGDPILRVTVQEPSSSYQVSIDQLKTWARQRDRHDTLGIFALKNRVSKLLAAKRGG